MDRRAFCSRCAGAASILISPRVLAEPAPWAVGSGEAKVRRRMPVEVGTSSPSSGAAIKYEGCYLMATTGAEEKITFLKSSGFSEVDRIIQDEIHNSMIGSFAFLPDFSYFDDSASPNAWANPYQFLGSGDGTVAFGVALVQKTLQQFANTSASNGFHAIGAILAHEFGHIAQNIHYADGFQPGSRAELQADFVSGWYCGRRYNETRGGVNFEETAKEMFDLGDYDFTSPLHHGTPQQRASIFLEGVALSLSGRATYGSSFAVLAEFDRRFPA